VKGGEELMADLKVGVISHYYDKIGVAVIELCETLAVGDTIRITGHGGEFTQSVTSMQMEHESVKEAKKGEAVGLKTDQPAKEEDEVFKVS
jgi:translation initiation factor IF-2